MTTESGWQIDPRSKAMFGDPAAQQAEAQQALSMAMLDRGFLPVDNGSLWSSRTTAEVVWMGNPGHWRYTSAQSHYASRGKEPIVRHGTDHASLLAWLDSSDRAARVAADAAEGRTRNDWQSEPAIIV